MPQKKYDNPFSATYSGIINMFNRTEPFGYLNPEEDMSDKTVMVTGANSGLGFATTVHMAKMGARVIMACRSGIPEAGERVKRLSGADQVEMRHVDLADFGSVSQLVSNLLDEGVKLDVLINNAAVVPSRSRKTKQGLEQMFVVNYLAPFYLINTLLEKGIIPSAKGSRNNENFLPRIVIVSSESHRSGEDINFETFGGYTDFTMKEVIAYYGYYKLALTTYFHELNRRINSNELKVSIHAICPGAVNTNIAREAPKAFQPLLKMVFSLFFQDPAKAAEPVVFLAASNKIEGDTEHYLHMWTKKETDVRSTDVENGKLLWEKSQQIIASIQRNSPREVVGL